MLVIGYAVFALVLCILIALMLRIEVERPMRHLARFTNELTPDRLTMPLMLSRPRGPWRDEIDLVADGFRTLQDAIHSHVANLDAQVASRTAQLQAALDEIRALTVTDALTGCFNRRHLDSRLAEETLRCHRSGYPLAVLMADIDHFKNVNDSLGHAAGDSVLRGVADVFKDAMRRRLDWVARFGGEEFVIVLPDTDIGRAVAIAERLRQAIEATRLSHSGHEIRVTASFGVAECLDTDDAASLLARADAMLYRAKESGRNRVVWGPPRGCSIALMERLKASDFPQEVLDLFDGYQHGVHRSPRIPRSRREVRRGGVTAAAMLESLRPNYAWAEQVPKTDPRIRAEYVTYRFAGGLRHRARLPRAAGEGRQGRVRRGLSREPGPQSVHRGRGAPPRGRGLRGLRARCAHLRGRLSRRRGKGGEALRLRSTRRSAART